MRQAQDRPSGSEVVLEYPIGTVLHRWPGASGVPCCFRVSPNGAFYAVMVAVGAGQGFLEIIDRNGQSVQKSRTFAAFADGVTWSSSGDEAWFNASDVGLNFSVYGLSLQGRERRVQHGLGSMSISDRAVDGRALLTSDRISGGIVGLAPGETRERDLSWMDFSTLRAFVPRRPHGGVE